MTTRALLVTTNGAGMGHLARMTAVALAGIRTGEIDPAIITLSVAAPLASSTGVVVEYCPSSARRWHPYWRWDAYFRDRLATALAHGKFDVVVFDGVMPYDGLLAVMSAFPDVRFAWCRRGFWRADAQVARRALARERFFDAVIEPADLGGADTGPTAGRADITTAPVTLLTEVQIRSREQARAALKLDPGAHCVYFSFGSGLSGESRTALAAVVAQARAAGWLVVATKPWQQSQQLPDVHYIEREFPLVQHVRAFDAVVTSAGYNSVHEFVAAEVPTLIIANDSLVTDDQSARARGVAAKGLALMAANAAEVAEKLPQIFDGWKPASQAVACEGAEEIARAIAALAHAPRTRQDNRLAAKLTFMAICGPLLVALARGLRGRKSGALRLAAVHTCEDIREVATAATDVAVEHIAQLEPHGISGGISGGESVGGSAGGYGAARRELAARSYPSRL